MADSATGARAKSKRRRRASGSSRAATSAPRSGGIVGGRYQPLNSADLPRLDQAVRKILIDVGIPTPYNEVLTAVIRQREAGF